MPCSGPLLRPAEPLGIAAARRSCTASGFSSMTESQLNRVEPPDAIDVVDRQVNRAVASRVEIRLQLDDGRLENKSVESATQVGRESRQFIGERTKIERAPRRWRRHRRGLSRGRTNPSGADQRARCARDQRPSIELAHRSPLASP